MLMPMPPQELPSIDPEEFARATPDEHKQQIGEQLYHMANVHVCGLHGAYHMPLRPTSSFVSSFHAFPYV